MSNELATIASYFPSTNMASLADDLVNVKTWDDFARRFLLGEGKSANTTRNYLQYCKQFYDFTGGLHPMQAGTAAWIESFYDSLSKSRDVNTCALAMASLRYLYKKICERFPAYVNPFQAMPKALQTKLLRTKKDESERDSLTVKEYQEILSMLAEDTSERGLLDYALFRFGVTSGMRAAELCGLTWGAITEQEDGSAKATFIGKGSKRRTIQLEAKALTACKRAFRARWGRSPKPSEYVFNASETGSASGRPGITKSTVHLHVKAILARAKARGLVRPNLFFSTHSMRHTCATLLLSAGVDIRTVQAHLGHSSLEVTVTYLHNKADLAPAFSKLCGSPQAA